MMMMTMLVLWLLATFLCVPRAQSFQGPDAFVASSSRFSPRSASTALYSTPPGPKTHAFQVSIDLPPSNSEMQVTMGLDPILSVPSELIVVRYRVPFGLNVEPKRQFALVTAAGPGGEQPGDVLRYTSQWTLGLPKGDGLGTTFASFAGGLSWQCSMFNVMSAVKWEQVLEVLLSNTAQRTDEVVLIFERPLNGVIPPELRD
jgi:hypothetical protein